MDSKATPLIDTDAKLFLTSEGSVGIILSNVIPASMKANEYDTSVAFTGKDLISCKCTCMCGGQGEEDHPPHQQRTRPDSRRLEGKY